MKQEQILINPQTAIRLFSKTYLHMGDDIFTNRKYKITREAWIASMFLLALKKHSGQEWFFRPETRRGSPDFYCYTFIYDEVKKGSIRPEMKLEVFEWRKEDAESNFLEALKRIKLEKIVDPQITILCYIRKFSLIPSAVELNKTLKKLNPKVKDIWYLGDITPDSEIWRVTQIYPNTLAIDLDYDEILTTKEEHSFIHSYRGKSKSVEFEPSNKQILLKPDFNLEIIEKE